jgi:DNA polymerase-3 subunit gamma/tau
MLTKEAWNALLKTLEEPPKHVIFILATTEIEKVPETIISRCQVFTFRKPSIGVLANLVENITVKEGFKIDKNSAELVAMLGDGSFRDTHGILQKIMSYSKDKKIDSKEISLVTGAPNNVIVNQFIEALAKSDLAKGLDAIRKASSENVEMTIFLKLILAKLRTALLLRYAKDMKEELLVGMTSDDREFMLGILKEKGTGISSKSLEILLESVEQTKYASIKELPLELSLVKILGE